MFWYIVMALIGGWLVGWTTRGIIERHLDFKVGTPSASNNIQSDAIALCKDIAGIHLPAQSDFKALVVELMERANAVVAQQTSVR